MADHTFYNTYFFRTTLRRINVTTRYKITLQLQSRETLF